MTEFKLTPQDNPLYLETMAKLNAPDPRAGTSLIDQALRQTSERYEKNMSALKAVATADWQKIPVTEARTTNQKEKTRG